MPGDEWSNAEQQQRPSSTIERTSTTSTSLRLFFPPDPVLPPSPPLAVSAPPRVRPGPPLRPQPDPKSCSLIEPHPPSTKLNIGALNYGGRPDGWLHTMVSVRQTACRPSTNTGPRCHSRIIVRWGSTSPRHGVESADYHPLKHVLASPRRDRVRNPSSLVSGSDAR